MKSFKSYITEGRPSQRHPLEGHEYHRKTDAELVHIAKDAHKAAEAMKSHNTQAENKYRDQANDSATVRYFRQKNGMPDWYKKKYGHMKEEVEQIDELNKEPGGTLHRYLASPKQRQRRINAAIENPSKLKKINTGMKSAETKIDKERKKQTGMNPVRPPSGPGPGVGLGYNPQTNRSYNEEVELDEVAAWQRKEGKNPEGGLNQKGVESYRRENPGSKLQTAVTTKPSKLDPDSKSAKRRKSFCARMGGMKKRLTSAKTANDPDSRINKALRKWNC